MELPFLVLASSLKRHLKGAGKIILHAFHSEPLAQDLAFFVALNSESFELRLLQIENRFLGRAIALNRVTAATFIRFLLPSVLKDIDRVVYLDCDLVVLDDIATLYDTNLLDFPIAACLDFWLTGARSPPVVSWDVAAWNEFLSDVVGLADCKAYFNAGVLVMNLKKVRDGGLVHAAEEFLERTNYNTPFVDQDALNHVINGAFARLDSRWNVRAASVAPNDPDPWIIHYAGPYKPWSCEGPRMIFGSQWFWREAMESAVLPLVVRAYLETCGQRGLTKVLSADDLLSSGKPQLSKQDIIAHVEKYRCFIEAAHASESLVRDLDRDSKERM
jgi:lipopolysaccharide biosynthesis glycosyltransferase